MKKLFSIVSILIILLYCKNDNSPVLSDFVDVNKIESVEMRDSISKYYLNTDQLSSFKKAVGQLRLINKSKIDSATYGASIKMGNT